MIRARLNKGVSWPLTALSRAAAVLRCAAAAEPGRWADSNQRRDNS